MTTLTLKRELGKREIGLAALAAASLLLAPRPAAAASWTVDHARSSLAFSGVQTGAPFHGAFNRYNANIDFDPDHPERAHIAVTVDLASAQTGDPQRDKALPGSDWFDVAHFPQAHFETTSVRRLGPGRFEAAGNLTLRGVTKPVTLPFTLDTQGKSARAHGRVELVRTAFGVGQGPWASGQWVGLTAGVEIDLSANRVN